MLQMFAALILRASVEKGLASKPISPALAKEIKKQDSLNENFDYKKR